MLLFVFAIDHLSALEQTLVRSTQALPAFRVLQLHVRLQFIEKLSLTQRHLCSKRHPNLRHPELFLTVFEKRKSPSLQLRAMEALRCVCFVAFVLFSLSCGCANKTNLKSFSPGGNANAENSCLEKSNQFGGKVRTKLS